MQELQDLYLNFLNSVPSGLRPVISIVVAILLAYSIFQIIKKQFIFIILLIILLPASIPLLKTIWQGVVTAVKFLIQSR